MEVLYCFPTVWGTAGFVSRDNKLSRLFLPSAQLPSCPEMVPHDHLPLFLQELASAVQNYFRGQRIEFVPRFEEPGLDEIFLKVKEIFTTSVPGSATPYEVWLDTKDLSPFTCRVLAATAAIPYGQTINYGRLSQLVCGDTKHARAVGQVMKRNPFPLVIPCHRVVGSSWTGGFSGGNGVVTKLRMLALEKQPIPQLSELLCDN